MNLLWFCVSLLILVMYSPDTASGQGYGYRPSYNSYRGRRYGNYLRSNPYRGRRYGGYPRYRGNGYRSRRGGD